MGTPAPAIRAGRLPLQDRLARPGLAALLAAAATMYILMLAQAAGNHQDLGAYISAGRDLWHGQPLYAAFLHHPFPDPTLRPAYIYPPVFGVLIAPLALLPDAVLPWVWLMLTQAALGATLFVILKSLRPSASVAVLAVCVTLTFYPAWVDAFQGQVNLLIVFLIALGFALIARARPVGGLAIGLAAALKLTPLALVAWLLVERRLRAAGFMILGFLGATAAGALLRLQDTLTFFGSVVPALARGTAFYANQSLQGVLARLFTNNPYTTPWLNLSGEILLVGLLSILLLAWWLVTSPKESDGLARALAFLPLLPLLSAVTWEHHLVVLLPLVWLCVARLGERGWPLGKTLTLIAVVACFDLLPRWHPGPLFGQPGFQLAQTADPLVLLTANSLFLGTLILFFTAPWLLRSR